MSLRLYVAGDALHSARALVNLEHALQTRLRDRYELEVVDVLRAPERALRDGVLLTPTLVRVAPRPSVQIVGDLKDTPVLLRALGLETE